MNSNKKSNFKRFGKFLILDELVSGGMATICRARYLGEQADKIVAIKMIREQFSKDESFKTMFMDELNLTFRMQHPNIVQTYDYGFYKNKLYVAMEYYDGKNLREYLDILQKKNERFPIGIATYIISQAAQGLFYAHTLTDKLTGKYLNIVHRDISPHNIMLTYDGSVKIIDFGIAKANSNSEITQSGMIKGKISYLAPEYIEGLDLNAQYDQFSLGLTFWEMLCGEKLFKSSENEIAILKEIQKCNTPAPSSINKKVPKELDDIILKSLSKNRDNRFASLSEMSRALTKFLYKNMPEFNVIDVSSFAGNLFKRQIEEDRIKFYSYGQIDISPFLKELKKEDEINKKLTQKKMQSESSLSFSKSRSGLIMKSHNENMGDTVFLTDAFNRGTDIKLKSQHKRKYNRTKQDIKPLKAQERTRQMPLFEYLLNRIIKLTLNRDQLDNKNSSTIHLPTLPKFRLSKKSIIWFLLIIAIIFSWEEKVPPGEKSVLATIKTTVLTQYFRIINRKRDDAKRIPSSVANPIFAGPTGKITINNIDRFKQKVFINGHPTKISILNEIQVPLNKEFFLRIETPDQRHFVTNLHIGPDEKNKTLTFTDQAPTSYGYLFSSKACFNGHIEFALFTEKRIVQIPIRRPIAFNIRPHIITFVGKDGTIIKKRFNPKRANSSTDICTLL